MESAELIVCKDISLGYEGQSVLTHLDLTVRAGDYLCIVGDNGSGKSTLLRGLLGLLPPQSGEIWRAPELQKGAVGYLPQQTKAQKDFPATVFEVVLSGFLNRKGMHFFYSAARRLLPGPVRRTAAAGPAGPGPVRRQPPADPGRAHHRPGPRRRPGPVQDPVLSEPEGGHGRGHGDPRPEDRPPQRPDGAAHRPG